MRNGVQLIAYADRLGGDLAGLTGLLATDLSGLFTGVHILPFYTPFDGADAGFDPEDHAVVDPRLGSWEDVASIGENLDVMADLIVNHMSVRSAEFEDWRRRGDESPFAGMFLTQHSVFGREPSDDHIAAIYRPRPGSPFSLYEIAGSPRLVWTTFTSEQVDIDVTHPESRVYLLSVLDAMAEAGVAAVRLDAVGYAVKVPGESCFMMPETFAFIEELSGWCRDRGLEVLVEIHAHHQTQVEIARRVDLVYDFALPPLILHALTVGDAGPLRHWLAIRPRNAVTVLDTHDGIGVIDVGDDGDDPGLLTNAQIDDLVESMHANSGGTSRAATGAAASNLDLYQVNCTYYDALGRDDAAYLTARVLQFFTPGIPQVYYVGLLAGTNDMDLLGRTGVGRDVNRHHYTRGEVAEDLRRTVVRELCDLIRLRSEHPAFDGSCDIGGVGSEMEFHWSNGEHRASAVVDVAAHVSHVEWTDDEFEVQYRSYPIGR